MNAALLLLLAALPTLLPQEPAAPAPPAVDSQAGPRVAAGTSGPARFVGGLLDAFDRDAAMEVVTFADGYYRAPANEGYDATLDHVRARLAAAGFGAAEGFELRVIESRMTSPAWTPRAASLDLLLADAEPERLHGFDAPGGVDRVMLPINAPSAEVEGPLVFAVADVVPGAVLVTDGGLGRAVRGAKRAGAALVLSAGLNDFTVDPRGGEEHLDAILFETVSRRDALPVGKISPRTYARLRALHDEGRAPRVRFRAVVEFEEKPLRTLVARVVGATRPQEAVTVVAHVQEPGAGDNASGVGGVCEAACALARRVRAEELPRPARSVVFVFGDEMRQSSIWLEDTALTPFAAISADMLGQARDATGAICLLERAPDPGALDLLPPDAHTPWGAGRVGSDDLKPNGLALVARTALADVARATGGWTFSENPWEGGSDHDVFLGRGVPAILIWHFTDFTYHTGLDRLGRLDPEELRRTSVGVLATALAVADLRRADLERYLASDALELELRTAAAETAARPEVAERWRAWSAGVGAWLRKSVVDPE
ncbi:MAG: M28 family peptidase [Planctomycetes bacterium]|nr:M28 family peptidase [Planctomycetota bacterium]